MDWRVIGFIIAIVIVISSAWGLFYNWLLENDKIKIKSMFIMSILGGPLFWLFGIIYLIRGGDEGL